MGAHPHTERAPLSASSALPHPADPPLLPLSPAPPLSLAAHTQATLEKVLTYHVVPGARYLPDGFTDGKALATLDKGNDLTITSKE